MMDVVERRLEALAELLAAGRSPVEATVTLMKVGGEVGRWARALNGQLRAGMPLTVALTQAGDLSRGEAARVGDGLAGALRFFAAQRGVRQARLRVAWGALTVPALMAVLSSMAQQALLGGLGGLVLDLLPLMVVVGVVKVGARRPEWLASLPGPLYERAALVSWARAVAVNVADKATALARAARLVGTPMSQALRVAEGAPKAEMVGEPLALAFSVGLVVGDLGVRLEAFCADEDARIERAILWVVRAAAWAAVVWVSLRGAALLADQMGNLAGLGDLGGIELGGDMRELEQLLNP